LTRWPSLTQRNQLHEGLQNLIYLIFRTKIPDELPLRAIQSKLVEMPCSSTIHIVFLGIHGSVDALIWQPLKIRSDRFIENKCNQSVGLSRS